MGSVTTLLAQAKDVGLRVTVDGDHLQVRGPRKFETLAQKILKHKSEILKHLRAEEETIGFIQSVSQIGQCEHCRAAGYWDEAGPGLWCFYEAAFLCKSGKAVLAEERRKDCPLKTHKPQWWEALDQY